MMNNTFRWRDQSGQFDHLVWYFVGVCTPFNRDAIDIHIGRYHFDDLPADREDFHIPVNMTERREALNDKFEWVPSEVFDVLPVAASIDGLALARSNSDQQWVSRVVRDVLAGAGITVDKVTR